MKMNPNSSSARHCSLLVLAFISATASLAPAATVWTGPAFSYTQPGTDPTQPANQDRITANVWLTRAASQGLFNARTEASFTHFSSPAGTAWANGFATNHASLTFTDWNTWAKGVNAGPQSTVGVNAVLHLISEDIYADIKFTAWGSAGAGGFAYQRSTAPVALPSPTVSITNPPNGAVFAAPANVQIQADAAVSSGSVTNVAFFGSGAPLGSDQTAPFGITTAGLAAGPYALTAVATAAGVSTTSSVVNITVVSPTPTVSITNPPGGTVFAAPANVQIQASAAVSSGSVTNVAFFGNGAPLGSDQTAPFSITTGSLGAGGYSLTAIATAAGVSGTSSVVSITVVSPVAISLSSQQISNGQFSFDYTANPGLSYVVQNSSNLVDWVPVITNVAASNPVHFADGFIPNGDRYYRVGRQPNP